MAKGTKEEIWDDAWISTQCNVCYGNCPIRVHRVNGVAVQIEGEPDCAATGGTLCPKGASALQLLYDPNRLNYPVKRTNPEKGIGVDPGWQRISWEEALDTMADKLRETYEEDPKQLFAQYPPQTSTSGRIISAFARALGGSVTSGGGGTYCGNSTHLICNRVHGAWSYLPDYQYCNYIIHFGSSKGHGAGHTALYTQKQATEARARGAKVVTFDPVCSVVGSKATEWVPILPGTDSAVALAMINVILNELGTYDTEHLKMVTNGPFLIGPDGHYVRDKQSQKPLVFDARDNKLKAFDAPAIGDYAIEGEYEADGVKCQPAFALLKEHVKPYTPEWASEISTAPAETIRRIATEFVQAASIGSTITIQGKSLPLRPAAAITFRGAQGHTNGFHNVLAVYLLNAIVGSDDVPGGAIGWPTLFHGLPGTGYPQYTPTVSEDGDLIAGWCYTGGHAMWPIHEPQVPATRFSLREPFPWVGASPFVDAADRDWWRKKFGLTTKRKVLLNFGTNTIMSMPDKKTIAESLKEWEYIFSFRLFLDEFTDFCDIVLPDTCFLEALYPGAHIEVGFCGQPGMVDWFYNIRQPAVEPLFERRQAHEVYIELARRISPQILENLYGFLNEMMRLQDPDTPYKLDITKEYTWQEICDRSVKAYMGDEYGTDWFKEHSGISWPKKVEECYYAPFLKNLRQPIYYEFILGMKERTREICEPRGVDIDWSYYNPMATYFPCLETRDPGYDLYGITYRHALHSGSMTMEIPFLDQASQAGPYAYNIQINAETGRKKGLKDGDRVLLESDTGGKTEGTIKLMQSIHPQVVAVNACAGHYSPTMPIARGKGTHFNDLLKMDKEHFDPVTFSIEAAARLRIRKIEGD